MNKTIVWETDMITSGIQQRIKQMGRLHTLVAIQLLPANL